MLPAVLSVTSGQLAAWLAAFLWPFVRILALIGSAPVLSDPVIPRRIKVVLAAALTLALAPALPTMPAVPLVSPGALLLAVQQVLLGVAMGFAMRLVFAAVEAAGDYMGLQMGLSFASFFDLSAGGQTAVIARLLNLLAVLVFLATDGHLRMIALLAASFEAAPVAAGGTSAAGWLLLVQAAGEVFATGFLLALPLVTALLVLNLAMGILNRASPQFTVFAVGFPLTLLAGIAMLSLLMPELAAFLGPRIGAALDTTLRIVRALGGG